MNKHATAALAAALTMLAFAPSALAEIRAHSGTVESISTGALTIREADGTVDHWRLDEKTRTIGRRPEAGDRVHVRVESNGHVAELRFEAEAPPAKKPIKLLR